MKTRSGRAVRERMEIVFFERLPGYGLLRSLTQRLAGNTEEEAWTPALVEIEEALVPAVTQAIRTISRWGSGSKDLVAAMRKE